MVHRKGHAQPRARTHSILSPPGRRASCTSGRTLSRTVPACVTATPSRQSSLRGRRSCRAGLPKRERRPSIAWNRWATRPHPDRILGLHRRGLVGAGRGTSGRGLSATPDRPGTAARRTCRRRLPCQPGAQPGGCRPMRKSPGGRACQRPARRTPGWDRHRWSSTKYPRSTSRPTRATGSASPASPRNAAWNRRSPSGCSPAR